MAIVYIGIVETVTNFEQEDACLNKHFERAFGNEEAAKKWIDGQRNARRTNKYGFSDEEVVYERWTKGINYCYVHEVGDRRFKVDYYYIDMEIED